MDQTQQLTTLLSTLQDTINNVISSVNKSITNQSTQINSLKDNINSFSGKINNINDNFSQINQLLTNISKEKFDFLNKESVDKTVSTIEKVIDSTEKSNINVSNIIDNLSDVNDVFISNNNKTMNSLKQQVRSSINSTIKGSKTSETLSESMSQTIEKTGFFKRLLRSSKEILKNAQKTLEKVSTITSVFTNMLTSIFSTAADFIKLTVQIPFSIISSANEIGKEYRKQLIEGIGQTFEDFKDKFNLGSYVGKTIGHLVDIGIASMKEFEDPSNEMVRLYGFGIDGIKNFINEFGEALTSMGHYAEVFSGTFRKNQQNLKNFMLIKREMGYENEDIAYFAMDAAVNLKGLNKRMDEAAKATKAIAKEYDIDQKMLSKNFLTLRKDVILFGHLTDEELNNTAAVMTRLKVKMEDAVAVFNKFSTFEDAANSVAILSQTFGMNLNALDMIKAEKPEEIFDMFRNAMLDTGRTFDDLSRFEKSIMVQQTGMSAESLKAMMNYTASGLTFQEARQKMEESSPEKQQIKSLNELQDAIKELKKVLEFQSPLEAIFKGLAGNIAFDKDVRDLFMMLSGNYEKLYLQFLNMPTENLEKIIQPLNMIVEMMTAIFSNDSFIETIKLILKGFGDLITFSFNLQDDIYLVKLQRQFNESFESLKSKNKITDKTYIALLDSIDNSDDLHHYFYNDDKKYKINYEHYMKNFNKKDNATKIKVLESLNTLLGKELPQRIAKTSSEAVTQTSQQLDAAQKSSSETFLGVADLGKFVVGALVRGFLTGATALLTVINEMISETPVADGVPLIEKLTGIRKEDFSKMIDDLGKSIGELFRAITPDSFTGAFSGIYELIMKPIYSVLELLASMLFTIIKSMFSDKLSNMSDKELQDLSRYETNSKDKRQISELLQQHIGAGEEKMRIYGSRGSRERIKNKHLYDEKSFDKIDNNQLIKSLYDTRNLIQQLNEEQNKSLNEQQKKLLQDFNEQIKEKKYDYETHQEALKLLYEKINAPTPAAPAPAPTPAPAAPAVHAQDFMTNSMAMPMTILGREDKPVDFSSAKGVVNYNSGFISMIFDQTEGFVEDLESVKMTMDDFYKNTSMIDNTSKSELRQKIEELNKKIDSYRDSKKEEKITVTPQITKEEIVKLGEELIKNNFIQMATMPKYTQGVASLNASILNSPTLNTGEFNSGYTYSYNK